MRTPPQLLDRDPKFMAMYTVWDAARKGEMVPNRSDVKPVHLVELLKNLSILEVKDNDLVFRLYGVDVATRTGVDLTGKSLFPFFGPATRESLARALAIATSTPCGVFASFDVKYQSGAKVEVECLSLPMRDARRKVTQILTMTQPRNRRVLDEHVNGFAMGLEFYEFMAIDIGGGLPLEPPVTARQIAPRE